MRLYVAGPYSAESQSEIEDNVSKAMAIGADLLRLGHAPFIPHLTHYFAMRHGHEFDYEDYLHWDFAFLDACHAVYLIAESPGADREVKRANLINIPIYRSLDQVPTAPSATR